jgi:thymidine kinase
VAELLFFAGTMDSGKSTMALQMAFTLESRGLVGVYYTCHDKAGSVIASRMGVSRAAVTVHDDTDMFWDISRLEAADFVICDEAQFYTAGQIDQLGRVVDELGCDVFAFGIMTDFQGRIFDGAKRLVEIADRRVELPVPALCWCGRKAIHNAKVVSGEVVREGLLIDPLAEFHTLCRAHYNAGLIGKPGV